MKIEKKSNEELNKMCPFSERNLWKDGYRTAEEPLLEELQKKEKEIEELKTELNKYEEVANREQTTVLDSWIIKCKELEEQIEEQKRLSAHEYLTLEMKLRQMLSELKNVATHFETDIDKAFNLPSVLKPDIDKILEKAQ